MFRSLTSRVAMLLAGSGFCALVYQIAWQREFRLIFGTSTAASAAVLAIFIGGLGIGSWLLGPRSDAHPRPVLFYSQLELLVTLSAALTPVLILLVRHAYVWAGGTARLGLVTGTFVRLLLGALVLAVPTIAMGGTMPAAARAVTRSDDARRQHVAVLYGINTLGAVVGCMLATFLLLEAYGTRETLWLAAGINLVVAMAARQVDRGAASPAASDENSAPSWDAQAPTTFVLAASGIVGFAFFLMELVWYRMLGPLLGGSVFTFGLVLAIALTGIGVGGLLYALFGSERRPTLASFGWSCLLEAAAIAAAYALGDRLAVLALVMQPLGRASFAAHVGTWIVIASIVVLATAVIAGYQFPMLIGLLGRGRRQVGQHIGSAYAANTFGAIVGSLAGGFGLLPWLGANGAWRFTALCLMLLGTGAILIAAMRGARRVLIGHVVVIGFTIAWLNATGPTAVWRHSGIGAGRGRLDTITSANQLKDWSHAERRAVMWDGDGTESSVALSTARSGYAFVVNGKTDGSARGDVGTQVMSGLLGGILNPRARRSMVVGLGTGSTAGWLGAIPGMERVDVVELEPLIVDVAQACRVVNRDVLQNPKVHVTIGDGREFLLTSTDTYDIISSEPSNPFRAGIASLFTEEYYRAARSRLSDDGVFIQWMQAYEIDAPTLHTVYKTLASVFPSVETWQTEVQDLMLIATNRPRTYHAADIAARVQEEPFRTALLYAWRAGDVHGLLAHYVANDRLTRAIAATPSVDINTDDRNIIEFGFARSVGSNALLANDVRRLARALGAHRPQVDDPDSINWPAVDTAWIGYQLAERASQIDPGEAGATEPSRRAALSSYFKSGDLDSARRAWSEQTTGPRDLNELAMLADLDAQLGSDAALPFIDLLRKYNAGDAETILATLRVQQGKFSEAADALEAAFRDFRRTPWTLLRYQEHALELAIEIASQHPQLAQRMFVALRQPFAVEVLRDVRLLTVTRLAALVDFKQCVGAMAPFENLPLWTGEFLTLRARCYAATGTPLRERAERDLLDFTAHEPVPFSAGVASAPQSAAMR